MKKITIISILLCLSFKLQAQLSFGVKAGLNYANIIDNTEEPYNYVTLQDYILSFHAGVAGNYQINDKWSGGFEVLFSIKGGKDDGGKVNFYYLNLPLLAKYQINNNFRVHAGPELGFRLAAYSYVDGSASDISQIYDKSFDLGASIGLDYLLNDKMILTARYTRGLLTVLDGFLFTADGVNGTEINSRVLNNCFQLSFSYLLKN